MNSTRYNTTQATTTSSPTATTTVLKRWPASMIESNGDYTAEAESQLEALIGGPLYEKQHNNSLPLLPVPQVKDTIAKLMDTALPLAENEAERTSFLNAVKSFEQDGFAMELQQRLVAKRQNTPNSSWLALWWNQMGYLQVRDPVVVNVSYFFHLSDDGTVLPAQSKYSLGVMRGAAALVACAEIRKEVCSGSMPHEAIGRKEPRTPLCSVAFKYMFHACRIPKLEQDAYRIYDPSVYTHCIVARKGRFFKVAFIDDVTQEALPLSVIEDQLQQCVQIADADDDNANTNNHNNNLQLGWLTSGNRDDWAHAREALLLAGGDKLQSALEVLESGAILLCLDDEEPESRRQCGNVFWHGGGQNNRTGGNRWFDKSVQIFVTNNGKLGLMGEHSMMDGMPMIRLADRVANMTYAKAQERTAGGSVAVTPVEDIFGACAEELQKGYHGDVVSNLISKAEMALKELIDNHQLHVQSFQAFGSSYIKQAGYSPDAFVQQAIQLATYRLFGKQAATYEATQTRPFLHGRTETTRAVSTASSKFLDRMGLKPLYDEHDPQAVNEKLELLSGAIDSHVKYMRGAAQGLGVDRHLLGLALLVKDGEEPPALLVDPVTKRSKHWRVSTSHLSHPRFDNWGFGEVVPDGVGVAYGIKNDCCLFNITARREHDWTDRLSHLLEEALLEMRTLCDAKEAGVSRL
eukprot:CAMPEP_0196805826 /NCGR_PEP_ID=MMETSP1362-20130617/5650_1 /TAXON_ID=163516 /ORGANISM="Leptocylindrus danicus, Strain CCMP1856" /LENGTH=689 /DNA_ID=CAMNT_0042178975 /DNA_START=200 /DNA_END=2269 /DNA_ORIENTATION=+